jgi:hypothetical protein
MCRNDKTGKPLGSIKASPQQHRLVVVEAVATSSPGQLNPLDIPLVIEPAPPLACCRSFARRS